MWRKYKLICCLGCLMGCAPASPKGVRSSREMRDVLIDLELASASIPYRHPQHPGDKPLRDVTLYAYVFQKNGLSERDFQRSNLYYSRHPQRYVEIMRSVVDSLKELKAQKERQARAQEKARKAYERFLHNEMPCVSCKPKYYLFRSP